jgi:predicted dehydrogenase
VTLGAPPRVAVIGAGRLGGFHLDKLAALTRDGLATLTAVIETDAKRRAEAAERWRIKAAARLEDLDTPVDAVVIATPTEHHVPLALAALGRGCDVLVEKPLAKSVAVAEPVVRAAKAAGLILQVGHCERFNPAFVAAQPLIRAPGYIASERLGRFCGRGTDDDVVLDLMIHDLDLVAALVPATLVEVRAIGVPVLTQKIDMAQARLAFDNGVVAQLSAGRVSLEPVRKLRVFTPERYLSIDCLNNEVKSIKRESSDDTNAPSIAFEPVAVERTDALLCQDRAFVRAVRERSTPLVDGEAALAALRLAEAVLHGMQVPAPLCAQNQR